MQITFRHCAARPKRGVKEPGGVRGLNREQNPACDNDYLACRWSLH
jgi:hypothetical protein